MQIEYESLPLLSILAPVKVHVPVLCDCFRAGRWDALRLARVRSGALVLSAPMVTLDSGDSFTLMNSAGGNLALTLPSGSTASPSGTLANAASTTITSTASGSVGVAGTGGFACGFSTQFLFLNVTGSGGGGSSSASVAAPQRFELFLTPTDGTTCTNTSQSGSAGTWINLPAANDCTPPASKANAKLLGWATSPDFPVAIAKRQVDNGWGAYETFNADGQLTGVFIPAGGATFLSAQGKLYAIWNE